MKVLALGLFLVLVISGSARAFEIKEVAPKIVFKGEYACKIETSEEFLFLVDTTCVTKIAQNGSLPYDLIFVRIESGTLDDAHAQANAAAQELSSRGYEPCRSASYYLGGNLANSLTNVDIRPEVCRS